MQSKGFAGETELEYIINKVSPETKVLKNLYIPKSNGGTTEVDIVFIDKTGVYVIESKNFGGYVIGDESDKNWVQKFQNDRRKQFKFFNPIFQNSGHVSSLVNLTNLPRTCFIPLVVFSDRCHIKNLYLDKYRGTVINRKQLKQTIKRHLNERPICLNPAKVTYLYNELKTYTNVSSKVRNNHNKNVSRTRNYDK